MKLRIMSVLIFCLLIAVAALSAQDGSGGKVIISYTLERLERRGSNQLAVWIESAGGQYIRTLFATNFMARRKGFLIRPQCCPEWVKAAGLASMTEAEIDAVSGATQKPGQITLAWDCTDAQGKRVSDGVYVYRIEGNLQWENTVLWTGRITVGIQPDASEAQAAYQPAGAEKVGRLVTEVHAAFRPD